MFRITAYIVTELTYQVLNKTKVVLSHTILPAVDRAGLKIYAKLSKKEKDIVDDILHN